MGGRYYITGVQLGMLIAFSKMLNRSNPSNKQLKILHSLKELLDTIESKQYICDAETFENLQIFLKFYYTWLLPKFQISLEEFIRFIRSCK
uniref:Uncharacterized protein n=1 Tax=viral metagenome TaxID=1070528 RepID=A0A6M3XS04_9ZZZZ